ncbi:MAG: MBL fold metallo-hydrolase [Ardenticatenia bacterium]|nr:MBL fold metallo-hydrolase [Ardenticatenia bacterium]
MGYCYVVINAQCRVLVDVGSAFPHSVEDLLRALRAVREEFGEPVRLENMDAVLISHGHVDHFSGLTPPG